MLCIPGNCPHCAADGGFNIFSLTRWQSPRALNEVMKNQATGTMFGKPAPGNTIAVFCAGTCAACNGLVAIKAEVDGCFLSLLKECVKTPDKAYIGDTPRIMEMYPDTPPLYAHPSLPPKVNQAFCDLQDALRRAKTPALILMGCRACLENACRELGGEGKNLRESLKNLRDKGILTATLFEWGVQIKNMGNEAAHELEGTHEDAAEMVEFTKLFLQYTFELPARINEIRHHDG